MALAATPPTLTSSTCPNALVVVGAQGQTTVTVSLSGPSGTPTCGTSVSSHYNISLAGLSVAASPIFVNATVIDSTSQLLSAGCPAVKIILDTSAPQISCPAYILAQPNTGNGLSSIVRNANVSATATYGTATISCGNYNAILNNTGYAFPGPSVTSVTCVATATDGNTASCTIVVNNTDITPPALTCYSNSTCTPNNGVSATCTLGAYNGSLLVTDGAGILGSATCSPSVSGRTFSLGPTAVTCSATNNANLMSSCTFYVNVVDTTPPVFTSCPSYLVYTTQPSDGTSTPTVNFASNVTATDGSGVQPINCPLSGTPFAVLTNTSVSCTATDNAGNTATCSFYLYIADCCLPTLNCPSSVSVSPST